MRQTNKLVVIDNTPSLPRQTAACASLPLSTMSKSTPSEDNAHYLPKDKQARKTAPEAGVYAPKLTMSNDVSTFFIKNLNLYT